MRDTFLVLGVVCGILGLILHDLWYVAVPALILSFLMSPPGRRPDGQKRLPGPLGGILDEIIISIKMKNCPHCGYKVLKKDTICFYCKNDINAPVVSIQEAENQSEGEEDLEAEKTNDDSTGHQ